MLTPAAPEQSVPPPVTLYEVGTGFTTIVVLPVIVRVQLDVAFVATMV
jgi:hypothetical protein